VFDASRLFVGGVALALASVAMLACDPQSDFEVEHRAVEDVERGLFLALDQASERARTGEARAALVQLMSAAELPGADLFACEIGETASGIADELLDSGAYNEARMGYAVAIYHVRACGEELPSHLRVETLALRQRDARATQTWAESPVTVVD
jgi:hypothetical protein